MLDDQQLAAIAANLQALQLDPVTHLRVIAALAPALLPADAVASSNRVEFVRSNGASTHGGELIGRHPRQIAAHEFQGAEQVAVVAPLIGENPSCDATGLGQNVPAAPKPGNGARHNSAVIPSRPRAYARQTHGEPMARAKEALEHNPSLSTTDLVDKARVSRATANRARGLTTNGSKPPKPARSADAGLGTSGTKRSLSAAAARDPDAHARAFLEQRLAHGPIPAADVDAEVDAHRLYAASVDRAVEDLDLVACRANLGKGRVACYATRDQAAQLGAVIPERGARLEPATEPRP